MNINAISNNTFKAEPYVSNIRYAGPVDDYVRETMDRNWGRIDEFAKQHDVKLNIAQRKDELLVNSGAVTTRFDMTKLKSGDEFIKNVLDNVRLNYDLKNAASKNLKKVLKPHQFRVLA